jgi:hypothetical protein
LKLFQHRLTFKSSADPRGDVVQFYGFPFKDDTAFYRGVVDPDWVAREGEEPNLEVALDAVKRAARYDRITIVDVWTDVQETDIYFMLAVASATKTTGDRLTRMSGENLAVIARAAKLGGVRACWMCSTYKLHELKEMDVPHL